MNGANRYEVQRRIVALKDLRESRRPALIIATVVAADAAAATPAKPESSST